MKRIRVSIMVIAVMLVTSILPTLVSAQNPSFAGKEFRRVWVDSTVPQDAAGAPHIVGATDLYLTSAGVFMDSRTWEIGMYYIDDSGGYTVAAKTQPEFSSAGFFRFVGAKPNGSMIVWPVANNNIYPCQIYDGNGLSAINSPTPAQSLNQGNYFDGRFVYLEHAGLGAVNIWYYEEGLSPQLWLDNSDFSDLATILDYDGESLAFATGTTGDFDIRLRKADGTLVYIVGNGDVLPGTVASTYTGTPAGEITEVDQGRVYIQGAGSGGEQVLFSSADGVTFDVVAKVGQVVPGLTVTITGMALRQVKDGKIWLQVSQSDGEKVLYQIVGGVWTRVAGSNDLYDGRVPIGFETYEHGSLGDTVVLALTTAFEFSSRSYYIVELYVNSDLPGFSADPTGLVMGIAAESGGNLSITASGSPGETNTIQATSSLTNTTWDTVGTIVADGSGLMEWIVSPTNEARFFRLVK